MSSVGNSPTRLPKVGSYDILEGEFVLDDLYDDIDFDFSLGPSSSSIVQAVAKKEIVKNKLKQYYQKLKNRFSSEVLPKNSAHLQQMRKSTSRKFKEMLLEKKQKLESQISTPPFLRLSDKIAFTLGIIVLCLTEYVLLKQPQFMPYWYTFLVIPLLVTRCITYHRAKYQYFLLDFCYFAQAMLLFGIYIIPEQSIFFQMNFALSNGPLLVGIVMWRNSLVFHDLDKLTSVFIHLFPALVTFSLRWYPPSGNFDQVCSNSHCTLPVYGTFVFSFLAYTIWQVMYLIKTEIIDKERLRADCDLITSSKWMSEIKPHPLWIFFQKKFHLHLSHAPYVLAATQYVYTFLTFIPVIFIYEFFYFHVAYLSFIFIICIWNGACFYFEIFSETYSKRLQKSIKEEKTLKRSSSFRASSSSTSTTAPAATNTTNPSTTSNTTTVTPNATATTLSLSSSTSSDSSSSEEAQNNNSNPNNNNHSDNNNKNSSSNNNLMKIEEISLVEKKPKEEKEKQKTSSPENPDEAVSTNSEVLAQS